MQHSDNIPANRRILFEVISEYIPVSMYLSSQKLFFSQSLKNYIFMQPFRKIILTKNGCLAVLRGFQNI